MGTPAARLMDMATGHQMFPPHNCMSGSSTVLINGRPACRTGDMWMLHCAPTGGCHPGIAGMGSSTVIIEGKNQSRVGDQVSCGSIIMTGSTNVLIGG